MKSPTHFAFIAPLALAALFAVGGCAGYRIGPVKPTRMEGVQTVAVPTFENKTLEPRVEVLAANALIKQIQQDGTYKVVATNQADAVIEGEITEITRRSARSVRGNVLATREFALVVDVTFTVKDQKTGAVIVSRTVDGRSNFFVGGDVQSEERQALPLAIEDAAIQIVGRLSEGW
jgi:hypothetical protein